MPFWRTEVKMICQKVIHNCTFDFDNNNNDDDDIVDYSDSIIVDLLNAHYMLATMLRTVHALSHMIPIVL